MSPPGSHGNGAPCHVAAEWVWGRRMGAAAHAQSSCKSRGPNMRPKQGANYTGDAGGKEKRRGRDPTRARDGGLRAVLLCGHGAEGAQSGTRLAPGGAIATAPRQRCAAALQPKGESGAPRNRSRRPSGQQVPGAAGPHGPAAAAGRLKALAAAGASAPRRGQVEPGRAPRAGRGRGASRHQVPDAVCGAAVALYGALHGGPVGGLPRVLRRARRGVWRRGGALGCGGVGAWRRK